MWNFKALVGVVTNKIGFPDAYSLPNGRRTSSRHKHHRFVGDNTNKGGKNPFKSMPYLQFHSLDSINRDTYLKPAFAPNLLQCNRLLSF